MHNEFTAIIEQDGEWYIAYCPEIPGANGQGRTELECRDNLVGLVNHNQVKGRRRANQRVTALTTGKLAARQVDARLPKPGIFPRLDPEEVDQLVLPLTNQRFRDDQQDPVRPLGQALRDHQTGLDGLAQPHLVRQNAAALPQTPQRKNHRLTSLHPKVTAIKSCL